MGSRSRAATYTTNAVDAGVRHQFSAPGSSSPAYQYAGWQRQLTSTAWCLSASAQDDQYTQIDNDLRLRWDLGGGTAANANLTHINRTHPRLTASATTAASNSGAGFGLGH